MSRTRQARKVRARKERCAALVLNIALGFAYVSAAALVGTALIAFGAAL